MSTEKNPIKEQLQKEYDELILAREYCKRLMTILTNNTCFVIPETRLMLKDFPHFNFLKHQGDYLKSILRRVCTFEISIDKGFDLVSAIYLQILEALNNTKKLFSETENEA